MAVDHVPCGALPTPSCTKPPKPHRTERVSSPPHRQDQRAGAADAHCSRAGQVALNYGERGRLPICIFVEATGRQIVVRDVIRASPRARTPLHDTTTLDVAGAARRHRSSPPRSRGGPAFACARGASASSLIPPRWPQPSSSAMPCSFLYSSTLAASAGTGFKWRFQTAVSHWGHAILAVTCHVSRMHSWQK